MIRYDNNQREIIGSIFSFYLNYAGACFIVFSYLNYFHTSVNKKINKKKSKTPASNSCCVIYVFYPSVILWVNTVLKQIECVHNAKPNQCVPSQKFLSRGFSPLTSSADSCRIASKLSRQRPVFSANNSLAHEKGSRPDGIRRLRCPMRAARLAGFPGKW